MVSLANLWKKTRIDLDSRSDIVQILQEMDEMITRLEKLADQVASLRSILWAKRLEERPQDILGFER